MIELNEDRKRLLRNTPPRLDNTNISFPEHYPHGRIVIKKGIRMLDWEDGKWVAYVKDGVRWEWEELTEQDYKILNDALIVQLDTEE